MSSYNQNKFNSAVFSIIILMGNWLILPCGMNYLFDSSDMVGLQTVSANTQYGILGQQAPELNLNTWIDGAGNPMDPIKLRDYRGKVVFLYFFQDW
jgi:hypothetical protein